MNILFIESDEQYILGLPDGFKQNGCHVKIVKDIQEEELCTIIEEFRPDLMMTMGWTKILTRPKQKILGALSKKYRLKHAYWATEDPGWTERWSLPYIETTCPDYIFTISRSSVPYYKAKGYKACYLPWACNPEFHKPSEMRVAYQCDIALVATASWCPCRAEGARILLKPLIERNYHVMIWGKQWDKLDPDILGLDVPASYLRGKLPYLETNAVYSSAKIVLGFQNSETELTSRTFEVLGARGFLLTTAIPAVLNTFIPEKHLAVSRSAEETLRVVNYYLGHDEERKIIACKGQQEVYDNYTYSHRATEILRAIGG